MVTKLEIDGKEYALTANRKAACLLINVKDSDENMIDEVFYALLKKEHNLSREEVSELLDKAEEEYGVAQLLELVNKITTEVFTVAEDNKFKTIEFLSRKKK